MIRLFHAALDEAEGSPAGVVLRGALDPTTLHALRADDYQREAQPLSSQGRILDALRTGDRLPDVDLGMRGSNFEFEGAEFLLKDHVFIIDGLQRVSTIIAWLQANPTGTVRLGATVHFNTTRDWERSRFHKLNNWRSRLSPNVLLRNMRDTVPLLGTLYGLSTNDKSFVLHGRVSWEQRINRTDLTTAITFLRVCGRLHAHKGPHGAGGSLDQRVSAISTAAKNVGLSIIRENMKTFFSLVDECWGIKSVQYKDGAVYMRHAFLQVLAKILSDHHDFWQGDDEKRLFIGVDLKRKIATFPIYDPQVRHLTGASGKAQEMLYILLRDHINSGKRTKRLRARSEALVAFEEEAE